MINFATAAGRNTNPTSFLREAKSGGIKYKAEAGATHVLYFPVQVETIVNPDTEETTEVRMPYAKSFNIHEWREGDKFKSTACINGIVITDPDTGVVVMDGSCPICDRISDAWEIYNLRKDRETAESDLQGEEFTLWMEGVQGTTPGRKHTLLTERKAKEPVAKMYVLVAQFKMKSRAEVELGDNGLPLFELKIMNASESRVEAFQTVADESGTEVHGTEFRVPYTNEKDYKHLYQKSQILVAPDATSITKKYPEIVNIIEKEAAKFDWSTIANTFTELRGMSTLEMQVKMDKEFKKFDAWVEECKTNPNAVYMEYTGSKSQPKIESKPETGKVTAHDIKKDLDPNKAFAEEEPDMDNI